MSDLVETFCEQCPVYIADQHLGSTGVVPDGNARLCPAVAVSVALNLGNQVARDYLMITGKSDDYVNFRLGQRVEGTENIRTSANKTAVTYRSKARACANFLLRNGEDVDQDSLRVITVNEIKVELEGNNADRMPPT